MSANIKTGASVLDVAHKDWGNDSAYGLEPTKEREFNDMPLYLCNVPRIPPAGETVENSKNDSRAS